MEKIIFRALTPIFCLEFENDNVEFEHSGKFKEVEYKISLKMYETGQATCDELMKYANEPSQNDLVSLHVDDESGITTKYETDIAAGCLFPVAECIDGSICDH